MFRHADVVCVPLVSCVHLVAVLNDAFSMTCSLLMLVKDARGDNMEESCCRAVFMTTLYVTISVSFCLPHPAAVNPCIICRGVCECTDML